MNLCHIGMLLCFVLPQPSLAVSELKVVALAGESTSFKCTASAWRHLPPGHTGHDAGDKDISSSNGEILYDIKDKGYDIHRDEKLGEWNLFLNSVTAEMAGVYECVENDGFTVSKSIQLIVLESALVCNVTGVPVERNVPNSDRRRHDECSEKSSCNSSKTSALMTATNEFIGPNTCCGLQPDQILVSCGATYFGNTTPDLELRNLRNNEVVNTACSNSIIDANSGGKSRTCNATVNATIDLDGTQFIWQTTNQETQTQNYTTKPLKILYAIDSSPSNHRTVQVGENVNCTANCSDACGYRWTWSETPGRGGNQRITCTDNLVAKDTEGSYRCEATCRIGRHLCDVTVMHVSSIKQDEQVAGESTTAEWKISAIIMAVVVIVIGLFAVALSLRLCRERRMTTEENLSSQPSGNESHSDEAILETVETVSNVQLNRDEQLATSGSLSRRRLHSSDLPNQSPSSPKLQLNRSVSATVKPVLSNLSGPAGQNTLSLRSRAAPLNPKSATL